VTLWDLRKPAASVLSKSINGRSVTCLAADLAPSASSAASILAATLKGVRAGSIDPPRSLARWNSIADVRAMEQGLHVMDSRTLEAQRVPAISNGIGEEELELVSSVVWHGDAAAHHAYASVITPTTQQSCISSLRL